ncbi:NlpC/P60 family protein [Streptomyces sp. 71268]|uniref:C40 family peptidase n=1 Tax=Streptomyces sp. 71268 TaxID=3002640 RepID=UPI0023F7A65D|nr:NlpC/P60 family protein [Streptomyces sp. 71268]WEV26997.1 NlpC/P60 family protein [Streptomyces sp. 71268]
MRREQARERGTGVRGEPRRGRGAARAAALVCAVAGILATPGVAHAAPDEPKPRSAKELAEVHRRVEALYREAERATDAYNLAQERQREQGKELDRIAKSIAATQREMAALRRQAGAMARAQYRSGGMSPEARVWLNADPEGFLDGVALARKGQHATKGVLGSLARTQADLDRYAKDASAKWARLEQSRTQRDAARKDIKAKLDAAKKLESELAAKERERLRELEAEKAARAQAKWLRSGAVKDAKGEATPAGERAVAFATEQIGKAYEWGAEGPKTFDCSGLTLRAWGAAGETIPRTSQEQWRQLPKVDIKDMRPGDLIIYHRDASHVGIYVGDGTIVHAPRPGRNVTLAGAGSMEILGVVRPDAPTEQAPDLVKERPAKGQPSKDQQTRERAPKE